MELSLEERFNALELGISWEVFEYLRESDIDALFAERKLNIIARSEVVFLWKRHGIDFSFSHF